MNSNLLWRWLVCGLLLVASCRAEDGSAETDRASEELRRAQEALGAHAKSLADNQSAIEQQKRDLLRAQQELADREKLLAQQQQELDSAQRSLQQARAAYAAAIKERFAKLDASIATLAKRTDARAKDALTGLTARRDQLAAKLAALDGTAEAGWSEYTRDVDTTFSAMERDLREVMR